ncbi:MAG: hypothetical protein IPK82_44355 [Polyangiaceae bacterium]|nr:hypothetical protein [Polyangiaceae bacterium]
MTPPSVKLNPWVENTSHYNGKRLHYPAPPLRFVAPSRLASPDSTHRRFCTGSTAPIPARLFVRVSECAGASPT